LYWKFEIHFPKCLYSVQNNNSNSDMVVHACNPALGRLRQKDLWVQGQPGLHTKTLSQRTKKDKAITIKKPVAY
jgi:hypothetical protein